MGQTRTPSTAARLPEAASTRVRILRSCSRLQLGGCCIFTENRWWSPCLRCVFSASGTLLGRPQRQVPLRRCALRRGRGCKQGRPCIAQVCSWRLDSDQGYPATPSPASQPVSRLRLNGARGAWHSACRHRSAASDYGPASSQRPRPSSASICRLRRSRKIGTPHWRVPNRVGVGKVLPRQSPGPGPRHSRVTAGSLPNVPILCRVTPESPPGHCRVSAGSLPSHCRVTVDPALPELRQKGIALPSFAPRVFRRPPSPLHLAAGFASGCLNRPCRFFDPAGPF